MTGDTSIENPAKRKLAAGGFVLCMSLRQLCTADAAMIVQASGFDALYIDREHSPISAAATAQICISALGLGLTPLVRVRSASGPDIAGALDGGALGVIVPHVGNRAQAEAAVREAKFSPHGCRSVTALSPATRYRALPLVDIIRLQNEATMVVVMLETAEGIANVDEIVAVPGADLVMIGPNDLSTELGIAGETRHPLILDAYSKVAAACRHHGKHFVGGGAGGPGLPEVIAMGARFLLGGSDVGYLMTAARQAAATMRAAMPASSG